MGSRGAGGMTRLKWSDCASVGAIARAMLLDLPRCRVGNSSGRSQPTVGGQIIGGHRRSSLCWPCSPAHTSCIVCGPRGGGSMGVRRAVVVVAAGVMVMTMMGDTLVPGLSWAKTPVGSGTYDCSVVAIEGTVTLNRPWSDTGKGVVKATVSATIPGCTGGSPSPGVRHRFGQADLSQRRKRLFQRQQRDRQAEAHLQHRGQGQHLHRQFLCRPHRDGQSGRCRHRQGFLSHVRRIASPRRGRMVRSVLDGHHFVGDDPS